MPHRTAHSAAVQVALILWHKGFVQSLKLPPLTQRVTLACFWGLAGLFFFYHVHTRKINNYDFQENLIYTQNLSRKKQCGYITHRRQMLLSTHSKAVSGDAEVLEPVQPAHYRREVY